MYTICPFHIFHQGKVPLCLCRWTGDPVVARAQHSSPSPRSGSGPAGTQTSIDANTEHNDGHGGTPDLQLLHACKLGNFKVAEHLVRQAATMQSYKSDDSQHVTRNIMMERDSEGVSCLHAIAQSPSPGETAWKSDNSSQNLSTTVFYAPLCAHVSSMQLGMYINILQMLLLSDRQFHYCE